MILFHSFIMMYQTVTEDRICDVNYQLAGWYLKSNEVDTHRHLYTHPSPFFLSFMDGKTSSVPKLLADFL